MAGIPANGADNKESIEVVFSAISSGDSLAGLWYRDERGNDLPLHIPAGARSRFYAYSGPRDLVLYEKQTDASGETVRIPRAGARLPEADTVLLLLSPSAEPDKPHTLLALPEALDASNKALVRLINASNLPVVASVSGEKTAIAPGSVQDLSAPSTVAGESAGVMFAVYTDEDWQLLFSTRWTFDAGMRRTVLIQSTEKLPKVNYLNENMDILRQIANDAKP